MAYNYKDLPFLHALAVFSLDLIEDIHYTGNVF